MLDKEEKDEFRPKPIKYKVGDLLEKLEYEPYDDGEDIDPYEEKDEIDFAAVGERFLILQAFDPPVGQIAWYDLLRLSNNKKFRMDWLRVEYDVLLKLVSESD